MIQCVSQSFVAALARQDDCFLTALPSDERHTGKATQSVVAAVPIQTGPTPRDRRPRSSTAAVEGRSDAIARAVIYAADSAPVVGHHPGAIARANESPLVHPGEWRGNRACRWVTNRPAPTRPVYHPWHRRESNDPRSRKIAAKFILSGPTRRAEHHPCTGARPVFGRRGLPTGFFNTDHRTRAHVRPMRSIGAGGCWRSWRALESLLAYYIE